MIHLYLIIWILSIVVYCICFDFEIKRVFYFIYKKYICTWWWWKGPPGGPGNRKIPETSIIFSNVEVFSTFLRSIWWLNERSTPSIKQDIAHRRLRKLMILRSNLWNLPINSYSIRAVTSVEGAFKIIILIIRSYILFYVSVYIIELSTYMIVRSKALSFRLICSTFT